MWSCPGDLNEFHTTTLASDSWNTSLKVALVLEEIQMPPLVDLSVMDQTVSLTTIRTGKMPTFGEINLDCEQLLLQVKVGLSNKPRRAQAQCFLKQVSISHDAEATRHLPKSQAEPT
jgi:hypothetical protein